MVPQPVKAVILLFPLDGAIKAQRESEDENLAKIEQPLLDSTILWIKQTVIASRVGYFAKHICIFLTDR